MDVALFLAWTLVVPSLLALLVVKGRLRCVLGGWLTWSAALLVLFGLGARGVDDFAHGAILFTMFFGFLAVPLLSLLFRLGSIVHARVGRPAGTAT